jgi:hypothetical protein
MIRAVSWNTAAHNENPLEYHDFLEARTFEDRLRNMPHVCVSDLTPPLDYMVATCSRLGAPVPPAEIETLKKIVRSKLLDLSVYDFFFKNKSFFREKWLNKANKEIYDGVEQPATSIIHGGLPNGNFTTFFDTWISVWGANRVSRPSTHEGLSPQGCQLLHTLALVTFELAINGVVHGCDRDGTALSRALSSRVLAPRDTAARQVSFLYSLVCSRGPVDCIMLQEVSESKLAALAPLLHDDYALISDPKPVHRHQQSVVYVNRHLFPLVILDSDATEMLKCAVPDSVVAAGGGYVFASVHATSDGLSCAALDQVLDIVSFEHEREVVVIGIDANTTTGSAPEFLETCRAKGFDCTNKELRPTSSKSRTCLQYQLQKAAVCGEKPDENPKDFILTRAAAASLTESRIVYSSSVDTFDLDECVPRMPHAGLPSDHAPVVAVIQEREK